MTNRNRHNAKRIFIAWLLMAVFMLPLIVKTLHVCQVSAENGSCVSGALGHHGEEHGEDNCAICHFAFLTFMKAESIVLAAVVAVVLFVFVSQADAMCVCRRSRLLSLRAPPYLVEE